MTTTVELAACSDVGRVRADNEDAVGVCGWLLRSSRAAPLDVTRVVSHATPLVVCDGMGGHAGGEVASALAAEMLSRPEAMASPDDIHSQIADVDALLQQIGTDSPELNGLGCTAVGLSVLPDGTVWLFNLGDSRCYRLLPGQFEQLSTDDRAPLGPGGRTVLTQCLGGRSRAALDSHLARLVPVGFSRFLLCTDGLWDVVPEPRVAEVLAGEPTPAGAAYTLVADALGAGAPDNVTGLVVDVHVRP